MTYLGKIDDREFFLLNMCDGLTYQDITDKYDVKRDQLSQWMDDPKSESLRQDIRRTNSWFNNRLGHDAFSEFEKSGKRAFYLWFEQQPRHCCYCGIEEEKLAKLFDYDTGILYTTRGRGRLLELERVKTKGSENVYTTKNCALACYLCNNHKSDLISAEDHKKYFAPQIRKYLDDQYEQLIGKIS
jgi:5-methylcytosine-specific restriction endonuclease McrA